MIHKTAGLAKMYVFSVLSDLGDLYRTDVSTVIEV